MTAVSPEGFAVWRRVFEAFDRTMFHYHPSGERMQPPRMQCRLRHADHLPSYVTDGRFVPNDLTDDYNANRRLDVFRCPMRDARDAYMTLAGSDESMTVEILRDGETVLRYRIPWRKRMVG